MKLNQFHFYLHFDFHFIFKTWLYGHEGCQYSTTETLLLSLTLSLSLNYSLVKTWLSGLERCQCNTTATLPLSLSLSHCCRSVKTWLSGHERCQCSTTATLLTSHSASLASPPHPSTLISSGIYFKGGVTTGRKTNDKPTKNNKQLKFHVNKQESR